MMMRVDVLRACTRHAPIAMRRLHFPRIANVDAMPNQMRQYSKVQKEFTISDVHFGIEKMPTSSNSESADVSCFTLRTSVHLPVPLNRVWADFHVPKTLNAITPPYLNFTILTPQPVEMGEGTIIDYRSGAHHSGLHPDPNCSHVT